VTHLFDLDEGQVAAVDTDNGARILVKRFENDLFGFKPKFGDEWALWRHSGEGRMEFVESRPPEA